LVAHEEMPLGDCDVCGVTAGSICRGAASLGT
jgi:hypothetical protein